MLTQVETVKYLELNPSTAENCNVFLGTVEPKLV
jgi:hypothetical protein